MTGDLQQGYFSTDIRYLGCVAVSTLEMLKVFVRETRVELLYSEIDREEDTFVHRMLFTTYEDVEIRFRSVFVIQTPCETRGLAR
jgi:hypothetical protein